jgi:predicted dienelactone hydrolase
MRARVNAALAELVKQSNVDAARTAAIGYCFGGTTALELARSGADIRPESQQRYCLIHQRIGTAPLPCEKRDRIVR